MLWTGLDRQRQLHHICCHVLAVSSPLLFNLQSPLQLHGGSSYRCSVSNGEDDFFFSVLTL